MTEINNMSDCADCINKDQLIEFQNDIITHQGKLLLQERQKIESQKEEIEMVTKRMKAYELQAIKNINLYESLKAITELAVKGLREIVKGDESYHTTIFEAKDWIDKMEVVAGTALSEIERLQNE